MTTINNGKRFGIREEVNIYFIKRGTDEVALVAEHGKAAVKEEVNRLIKLRDRTKNKRIKKKINARIDQLLER